MGAKCLIERTAQAIILVLLVSGVAGAQTPSWRAPIGGFHFDRLVSGIRPVLGSIGSAQLGPVWLNEIRLAGVAPDSGAAVVERAGVVYWVPDLSPGATLTRRLETPPLVALRWSVDARRAVFVHAAGLSWWVREGTDLQLSVRWPLSEGSAWELLAASPDAQTVLLAERTPDGTRSLWLGSNRAIPQRLDSPAPRSAVFLGSTSRAAVLDDAGRIQLWRGFAAGPGSVEGIPHREELADASESSPSAIAATSDGRKLFLISRERRTLQTFLLESREFGERQELGFEPLRTDLLGPDHILLNDRATVSDPLRVLDLSLERIFFVPAGPDGV